MDFDNKAKSRLFVALALGPTSADNNSGLVRVAEHCNGPQDVAAVRGGMHLTLELADFEAQYYKSKADAAFYRFQAALSTKHEAEILADAAEARNREARAKAAAPHVVIAAAAEADYEAFLAVERANAAK